MPIISATALKGGVGKTTLVHMLSGAFSLSGMRVLCLDNDAQNSLSSGFLGPDLVEQFDPSETIAAIYAGHDPDPSQVIRPSGVAGVDLVAGSIAAGAFNKPDPHTAPAEDQLRLKMFLDEIRDQYQMVLIDNPPNLNAATWAAMIASDYSITPLIPENYGTMSLSPVFESIRLIQSGPNPSVSSLGLILTMVQPRIGVHIAYENVLREVHGDAVFTARIPMATDIKEAISHQLPVTHYKKNGASSKAFKALAAEILTRIEAASATAPISQEAA